MNSELTGQLQPDSVRTIVKELDAIKKINTTIGTLLDLNAVLPRIIDEIVPLFAAQAASVILFDYAKQEAKISTVYGTQPLPGQPFRYHWHGSLAGWVADHKRSLRLSRLLPSEWPTSVKLAKELGGSLENISVLLAPFSLNGEVLGCLEVVWDPRRDIRHGDEQLLETIAAQVAIAIANAQLYTERQQAEAALQQRQHLFMAGPVVVFRWRAEEHWPVEYVSPNIAQFGYDGGDLLSGSLPYRSLIHPEDRDRVAAEVTSYGKTGATSFEQDYRIVDAYRHTHWVYDFTVIGRDLQGRILHYDGYLLDITERKKTEAALRASEEQFRSLFEYAGDAIAISDTEGQLLRVNRQAESLLGMPREELLATHL
ncbi:MAG: PAS domain S-box protein [Deltaproteobacteria bacterium]|nr:PAS domain S-box protein [Deltaproteobacteria bacterium]